MVKIKFENCSKNINLFIEIERKYQSNLKF